MNFEEKIIQKIKEKNLKPKSVWYFLIRDYSLWGAVFLSIILASLSISSIIFIFSNIELGYIKHISPNPITFVLYFIPYTWIILCIITTYFATLAWSKTKNGYKFKGEYVIIVSVLLSLIIAIILNLYQIGKSIDEQSHQISFGMYKSQQDRMQENWFNPKEGRFIGVVENLSTTTFILLNEPKLFQQTFSYDETVPGIEFLENGNQVRIIGFRDDGDIFETCAIFPDSFLPPKERTDLKNRIEDKKQTSIECKEILDIGRANFKPQH